mmetsp:Transcript_37601/g.43803  ORF Transcript_37601/g.43803 Transcript_37601/m.43803 type:complete len:209 (+) Transcript_37601:170-796(+)
MKCLINVALGGMEGGRGPSFVKDSSQIQFDEEDFFSLSPSINLKLCSSSCDEPKSRRNGALNQADSALKKKTRPRRVSFGGLEVRSYSLTLSDHPGTTFGPAIGLSWDHVSTRKFDLEYHEAYRTLYCPRRLAKDLYLTHHARRKMLLNELKFSTEEIEKACSVAELIQKQRISSQSHKLLEPVQIAMESLKFKMSTISIECNKGQNL